MYHRRNLKSLKNTDDCGEVLLSLKGIDLESHTNEYTDFSEHWTNRLYVTDEDSDDEEEESFLKNVQLFMFNYADCDLTRNLKLAVMQSSDHLSFVVDRRPFTHLIAEICGGEARTTQLAVRQRYETGPNFDLVCNIDLTKKGDAQLTYAFLDRIKTLLQLWHQFAVALGQSAICSGRLHQKQ